LTILVGGTFRLPLESREAGREALAAHFSSDHMQDWRREREALGMTDRHVIAYVVAGKEVL
jgi:hypothetical protein